MDKIIEEIRAELRASEDRTKRLRKALEALEPDAQTSAKRPTTRGTSTRRRPRKPETARERAIEILKAHPEGMRRSELGREIGGMDNRQVARALAPLEKDGTLETKGRGPGLKVRLAAAASNGQP